MSKVRNLAEITPNIGFTEYDFYDFYRSTFEKSELGRIKNLLSLCDVHRCFLLRERDALSDISEPAFGRNREELMRQCAC